MNKTKKGFTLFELLVSISIIGILTALGVVSFSAAQKKARDSRRIQDMDAIQKALESYYSQNNYKYPTTVGGGLTMLIPANMQSVPADPKAAPYPAYSFGGVGGAGALGTDYCVCATLENNTAGNSNASTCSNGTFVVGGFYCVKSQQ